LGKPFVAQRYLFIGWPSIGMIYIFDDFEKLQEKAHEFGITGDLAKLRELDIMFYEVYEDHMIISFVAFESKLNKIVVLSNKFSLVFPSEAAELKKVRIGKMRARSKHLESTMCAYAVLKRAIENYSSHFEERRKGLNALERGSLSLEGLDEIERKARRFRDVIEDLLGFLIVVEKREVPFINVRTFPYEFDILRAETQHLNDRAISFRREVDIMRNRWERRAAAELNRRIEKLTEIMKKLTALTVIFMVPTLVASIYGMNFANMPELEVPEAYPLVILLMVSMVVFGALFFRKWEWL
jgi:magnesium transporter